MKHFLMPYIFGFNPMDPANKQRVSATNLMQLLDVRAGFSMQILDADGLSTTSKAVLDEISSYVPIASNQLAIEMRAAFPSEASRAHLPRVVALPISPLGFLYTVLSKPLIEHNVARVDPFAVAPIAEGFWQIASVSPEFTWMLQEWIGTEKDAARFLHSELSTRLNFRKNFTKDTVRYIDQVFFKAKFRAMKSA